MWRMIETFELSWEMTFVLCSLQTMQSLSGLAL